MGGGGGRGIKSFKITYTTIKETQDPQEPLQWHPDICNENNAILINCCCAILHSPSSFSLLFCFISLRTDRRSKNWTLHTLQQNLQILRPEFHPITFTPTLKCSSFTSHISFMRFNDPAYIFTHTCIKMLLFHFPNFIHDILWLSTVSSCISFSK